MTAPKTGAETLLIVEDEAQIRKFVRISLEAQGYRVWEARLGEEGLSLCAATPPHLVILDLGLPDVDGLDFIRRLRAWSHHRYKSSRPSKPRRRAFPGSASSTAATSREPSAAACWRSARRCPSPGRGPASWRACRRWT